MEEELTKFVNGTQKFTLEIKPGEYLAWLSENPEGDYKEFLDEKWGEWGALMEKELDLLGG